MFGMSLSFKILLLVGLLGIVAAGTAKFTADHVATKYENILLAQKVAVVTRERKVAVLDTKALEKATANIRAQLAREQEEKELLNEILKNRANAKPWCELNDYELCNWNNGNRLNLQDDSGNVTKCDGKLPGAPEGGERPDSGTVVK